MSENDGLEIPVWIGGCEKWVTGLTKRTTCDDVIYALLCHASNPNDVVDIQNYAIYERWREMERSLRGRTKILKVWRAWGTECHNVKFYMRKVENLLDESCEVSSIKSFTRKPRKQGHHGNQEERRHKTKQNEGRSREKERNQNRNNIKASSNSHEYINNWDVSNRGSGRDSQPRYSRQQTEKSNHGNGYRNSIRQSHRDKGHISHRDSSLPNHRDSSHRRSADRQQRSHSQDRLLPETAYPCNLTSNNTTNQPNKRDTPLPNQQMPSKTSEEVQKSQAFHQLVQVIIEQEKKLQELQQRVQDTDRQIESHETKVHMLRMQKNGQNYVQEAYLRDKSDESSASSEELFPHVKSVDLDAYIHICENILELQDKISDQESKVEDLSTTLLEESYTQGNPSLPQTPPVSRRHVSVAGKEVEHLQARIEDLSHEVERCQRVNVTQQDQFDSLEQSIKECDVQMQLKMDYMCKLQCEIDLVPLSGTEVTKLSADGSREATGSKENTQPSVQFLDEQIQSPKAESPPSVNNNNSNKLRGILKDTQAKYALDTTDMSSKNMSLKQNGKTMVPYCTYTTYQDTIYQNSSPTIGTKLNVSDDSDTGLSSLHSDDPPLLLETLV